MIRVVTLDEFDPKQLGRFCQTLYTAFGVGCEHTGDAQPPSGFSEPFDAPALIAGMPRVAAYQDDKIVFLTKRRLADRELPSGKAPTPGFALQGRDKAVVSTHPRKDLEEGLKYAARHALHQVGHLWELHHCLDPRCSMYPPWTPSFQNGDAIFCTFCREKSEQKIRLAKS
jgi:archaemetzincin